jgi:putative salt-induced outer membrane protein YdiY
MAWKGYFAVKTNSCRWHNIFIRITCGFLIIFLFLMVSNIAHGAQPIDQTTRAVSCPGALFALAADGEPMSASKTDSGDNKELQKQIWEPPVSASDKFDWIQLTSGEWLKGDLKSLYDEELEFDSDGLGLQEFDWEDVKYVRGTKIFSVRLMNETEVNYPESYEIEGLLEVTENQIIVVNDETISELKRDQILSIAPGGDEEINYWTGKIGIGLNLTSGNTDQTEYNGKINLKRRTSATRYNVDYLGKLTKTDGDETINNHRVSSSFDVFIAQKFFLRPVFGEYYRDPIKNIQYQVTIGSAAGYHIINTSKTEFDIAGGPAFKFTEFESVEPGEDSNEWTPAFYGATEFNTELTQKTDFDFLYEFLILNEKSGTYTHHMVATLGNEIMAWLDFDISFVWDHIQDPAPASDGTEPDKDDFYYMLTLGVDF